LGHSVDQRQASDKATKSDQESLIIGANFLDHRKQQIHWRKLFLMVGNLPSRYVRMSLPFLAALCLVTTTSRNGVEMGIFFLHFLSLVSHQYPDCQSEDYKWAGDGIIISYWKLWNHDFCSKHVHSLLIVWLKFRLVQIQYMDLLGQQLGSYHVWKFLPVLPALVKFLNLGYSIPSCTSCSMRCEVAIEWPKG
jgi:hypothetical protein